MVRAVLDANVVLSALLRPEGPPGRVVGAFMDRVAYQLVITPDILAEMGRAFRYPKVRKRIGDDMGHDLLVDFLLLGDLVDDCPLDPVARDPDDDKYLWAAIAGRADYIVTGDDDLLSLRQFRGVAILTPRDFLGVLKIGGR